MKRRRKGRGEDKIEEGEKKIIEVKMEEKADNKEKEKRKL
jgi:hypothetical protein